MPNLKLIAMRLKSVKNIQKITQSMKMVSAAKFAKAERDLKNARPLGIAAQQFYKSAEVGLVSTRPTGSIGTSPEFKFGIMEWVTNWTFTITQTLFIVHFEHFDHLKLP